MTQQSDSSQPKFTAADLSWNPYELAIPENVLKVQADVINVNEGWVDPSEFSEEYNTLLNNYYRFNAFRQDSKSKNIVNRDRETLGIVG